MSALVLASVLATSTTGCMRGGAGAKLAFVAAVVAVKTVQAIAAAKSRESSRTRYTSTSSMPPSREVDGCGRCPEPDNGYAICFISTCEVRCIEGYVLSDDACLPRASVAAAEPEAATNAR